jgi:hypothetical protein
MNRYRTNEVDNRDASQIYDYLESRIEFMKRRIIELENENRSLRHEQRQGHCMPVLESA